MPRHGQLTYDIHNPEKDGYNVVPEYEVLDLFFPYCDGLQRVVIELLVYRS